MRPYTSAWEALTARARDLATWAATAPTTDEEFAEASKDAADVRELLEAAADALAPSEHLAVELTEGELRAVLLASARAIRDAGGQPLAELAATLERSRHRRQAR